MKSNINLVTFNLLKCYYSYLDYNTIIINKKCTVMLEFKYNGYENTDIYYNIL